LGRLPGLPVQSPHAPDVHDPGRCARVVLELTMTDPRKIPAPLYPAPAFKAAVDLLTGQPVDVSQLHVPTRRIAGDPRKAAKAAAKAAVAPLRAARLAQVPASTGETAEAADAAPTAPAAGVSR
jgi:hypothetical protein